MDKPIPMTVAGQSFQSKKQLNSHVQLLLHSTAPGYLLPDLDFQFMEDLFNRHPWAKHFPNIWDMAVIRCCGGKKGYCEPVTIDDKRPRLPTRCLLILPSRGDPFCFNYHHCVYPLPGLANLRKGCRTAVKDDITGLKRTLIETDNLIRCSICYNRFPFSDIQMDHIPPFTLDQLVWDWMETETIEEFPGSPRGLYITDVPLAKITSIAGKVRESYTILDEPMQKRWKLYHRAHASLRPVCKRDHEAISEAWTDRRNVYRTGEEFIHALSALPGRVAQRRSLKRVVKLKMKTAFKKPGPVIKHQG